MKSNRKSAVGGGMIVNSPITLAGLVVMLMKSIDGGHQESA